MTETTKLTKEQLFVILRGTALTPHDINDILEYIEKAEKWDNYLENPDDVVKLQLQTIEKLQAQNDTNLYEYQQYAKTLAEREQENKQLQDSNFTLKKMQEDLEESMDYDEETYDLVTEKNRLKQKLEKIDELHLKYYRAEILIDDFHTQLRAILKESK